MKFGRFRLGCSWAKVWLKIMLCKCMEINVNLSLKVWNVNCNNLKIFLLSLVNSMYQLNRLASYPGVIQMFCNSFWRKGQYIFLLLKWSFLPNNYFDVIMKWKHSMCEKMIRYLEEANKDKATHVAIEHLRSQTTWETWVSSAKFT